MRRMGFGTPVGTLGGLCSAASPCIEHREKAEQSDARTCVRAMVELGEGLSPF